MDIAAIKAEFGAYYINQGQNAQRLYRLLRALFLTQTLFTLRLSDETRYQASQTKIGRLVQPFQKAWTPIGGVEFLPIIIEQHKIKMDHQEYPDDLEATWLGFLASENLDRKTWPFIRWLIENEILPQIKQDLELNEIYKGVATAPTPGTAGAASTAMNGIKHVINTHIANGRITPISTGALETSDPKLFVAQIEDFCKQIMDRYRMAKMTLVMSEDNAFAYQEGFDQKYNVNYKQDGQSTKVRYRNIEVVGMPSHNGSDKIWCTPKENAILMQKKTANQDKVLLENIDRLVKLYTDFWMGLGFIIPEIVFTNDLELT